MGILVTNDDGIHSEGLHVLANSLSDLGKVVIVAPDRERSAVSHSLTIYHPLRISQLKENIFVVNGTPADCVMLAVHQILSEKPKVVVAGINKGPNMGEDIRYSGTVSAAWEGTFFGIPSFAISLSGFENLHFNVAGKFARMLAEVLLEQKLPPGTVLNVNVPNLEEKEIKGVRITRQGKFIERYISYEKVNPEGELCYQIGNQKLKGEREDGTDFAAIDEGMISITPLKIDLTHYSVIEELKRWELVQWKIFG